MTPGVAMPQTAATSRDASHAAAIRIWLIVVAVLVVAMVAVGGATRLTDSGLSITEWQPILGAIPPLSEADWQAAFTKYKQIPEYSEVNAGMSLAAFKFIFWWEWSHRFLGRFIGVAFALPLAWFWLRGAIPDGYRTRLLLLLALGGLQGFIGWYMVKSGLVDRVDVSQYRLALHLCIAFLVLGVLTWFISDLSTDRDTVYLSNLPAASWPLAVLLALMVFAQVALGAFVAGTKAGLVYNTWPLMDGQWIPDHLYDQVPWWTSLTEDHLTIQFNHRMMAYALVVLALVQAVRVARADDPRVGRVAWLLALTLLAQAGLGIWTLVSAQGAIPIWLGLAHQGFAAIVFIIAIRHLFVVNRARRR
jgi:cytochrome c oxidase assembly protein subunit 15